MTHNEDDNVDFGPLTPGDWVAVVVIAVVLALWCGFLIRGLWSWIG